MLQKYSTHIHTYIYYCNETRIRHWRYKHVYLATIKRMCYKILSPIRICRKTTHQALMGSKRRRSTAPCITDTSRQFHAPFPLLPRKNVLAPIDPNWIQQERGKYGRASYRNRAFVFQHVRIYLNAQFQPRTPIAVPAQIK